MTTAQINQVRECLIDHGVKLYDIEYIIEDIQNILEDSDET